MPAPLDLDSRRELLVDDFLFDHLENVGLRLHHPVPQEVVLRSERPWEGNMLSYPTVLRVGDRFRLYYTAWALDLTTEKPDEAAEHPPAICVAESEDGLHWERPELDLYAYQGQGANNIVWLGDGEELWGVHGFSPFLDANPDCPPTERWKAVGGGWAHTEKGLYLLTSPDGLRWSLSDANPLFSGYALDSHNTVQWDALRGEYRAYFRHWTERPYAGGRTIMTATSPDLRTWSEPIALEYPGTPFEQLYTNGVASYYRAAHLWLGLPTRYVEREWSSSIEALPELEHRRLRAGKSPRYGAALTDALFMSSRDGLSFRRWGEAFLRPGLRSEGNWTYGDNYVAWGMLETDSALPGGEKELSFYASEGYWRREMAAFRRFTLRIDGFVSLCAPLSGGEMLTKPLTFAGRRLSLNISTSAAGHARVELQDAAGQSLPGYALDDCWDIIGDTLDYTVQWKSGPDVSALAGRPVRLRVVLSDADLYSLRFEDRGL